MHRARGIKPWLVIGVGDAKWCETDAGGFDIGENEGGGGREDISAFAHLVWTTGIHAANAGRGHIIVHGITAQFGKNVAAATENCLLCRATVDFGDADVAREGGFLWIDQKAGIAKAGSVAVDGRFHPAEGAVITAAEIEGNVTAVVIHIHGPGEIELLVIIDATCLVSLGLTFGQRGEEKAGEDSDNRNNNEQLDESERGTCSRCQVHAGN